MYSRVEPLNPLQWNYSKVDIIIISDLMSTKEEIINDCLIADLSIIFPNQSLIRADLIHYYKALAYSTSHKSAN